MILICSTLCITCSEKNSLFQTAHLGVSPSLANNLKNQNHQAYSAIEESSISSISDKKNQNM